MSSILIYNLEKNENKENPLVLYILLSISMTNCQFSCDIPESSLIYSNLSVPLLLGKYEGDHSTKFANEGQTSLIEKPKWKK